MIDINWSAAIFSAMVVAVPWLMIGLTRLDRAYDIRSEMIDEEFKWILGHMPMFKGSFRRDNTVGKRMTNWWPLSPWLNEADAREVFKPVAEYYKEEACGKD